MGNAASKSVNQILPVIPRVNCPSCLVNLINEKYDGSATVTFYHWVCTDCKFSGSRWEIVVPTVIGFVPQKIAKAKRGTR